MGTLAHWLHITELPVAQSDQPFDNPCATDRVAQILQPVEKGFGLLDDI
jgi:hypothetical protein